MRQASRRRASYEDRIAQRNVEPNVRAAQFLFELEGGPQDVFEDIRPLAARQSDAAIRNSSDSNHYFGAPTSISLGERPAPLG
jgi:hypothetical protein